MRRHPAPPGLRALASGQGRPLNLAEKIRALTGDLEEQIEIAIEISRGGCRATARDRLAAVDWLVTRVYGKPLESVVQLRLTAADVEGVQLSDEQLEGLARTLHRQRLAVANGLVQTVDVPNTAESLENAQRSNVSAGHISVPIPADPGSDAHASAHESDAPSDASERDATSLDSTDAEPGGEGPGSTRGTGPLFEKARGPQST